MTAFLLMVALVAGTAAYLRWALHWIADGAAAWWFVVGAPIAYFTPAFVLVRRWHRAGLALPALLVTAMLGLLASPISWSHHWVWAVPLLITLYQWAARAGGRKAGGREAGPVWCNRYSFTISADRRRAKAQFPFVIFHFTVVISD